MIIKRVHEPSIKYSMVKSIIQYVLLPLFITLAVLLFLLRQTTYRGTLEAFQMMFDQNVRGIDSMILQANYASSVMITYTDYNVFLKDYYEVDNEYDKNLVIKNLRNMLVNCNVAMLGGFRGEMVLVMNDGRVINSSGSYRMDRPLSELPWYQSMRESGHYPYWDDEINELFQYDATQSYVAFGRVLVRYQEEPLGYALVRIPRQSFFQFGDDPRFNKGTVIMVSADERILLEKNETIPKETAAELYNQWKENDRKQGQYGSYYVMASTLSSGRDLVMYIGKTGDMFARSNQIFRYVAVFMALSAAALMWVVLSISRYITRPILFFADQVMQIGQNRPELLKLEENHFLETKVLENGILQAQQRIQLLMEEVRKETVMKEQARFDALKAQINPHFLFNTLNAIRWKASINGDNEVADILSELGILLGETYQDEEEFETIDNAMRILDAYVKIMQVRFDSRVQFFFTIPEQLKDYLIPRFCLQPLVENSFIHGMAYVENGIIVLRGELQGKDIVLTLIDNGAGIQGRTLDLELEKKPRGKGITGIGLSNIHKRIRTLYGENYGLTVDTEIEIGFKISLKIPVQRREETADESADRGGRTSCQDRHAHAD